MVNNFQEKANFIWQVADDVLRGTFKAHEYGDVILPFVVLLLSSGADYLTVFTADQLHALVPLFLNLHEHGILIAGIF